MDGRLARRTRAPPPQGLPLTQASPPLAGQAARTRRKKKKPRLGSVAAIAQAWAEATTYPHQKLAALELARAAGHTHPNNLTELLLTGIVARWKQRLRRNTVALYTRNLRRLVRHIAKLCDRPDLVDAVPSVPTERPRTVIAGPGEIERILALSPPWLRVVLLLCTHAALRSGDALRVKPTDYNPDTAILTIKQKKTGNPVSIPATSELANAFDNCPEGPTGATLAELYKGEPIPRQTLSSAWQKAKRQAAANPDLTLHDLRRTTAVSLYEVSKDLRIVEQMLGHQSLRATAHYLEHRDPSKLKPLLAELWTPKGPRQ